MTDIPNILFVSLNYPPPLVGGSHIYWNQILTRLPPNSVTVLASSKGDPTKDKQYDIQFSFTSIRLPITFHSHQIKMSKWRKAQLLLKWAHGLYRHLDKPHEVVILQDVYNLGFFVRVLCNVRALPYVVCLHGEELARVLNSSSLLRRWRFVLYRWVLGGSHGIIVSSNNTRSLLAQMGVTSKSLEVIYPPTPSMPHPPAHIVGDWLAKHQLTGKRIVLTVGRLIRRKGHDYLLQAWSEVVPHSPDAVLVIAGDGPMYDKLAERIQSESLTKSVLLLGQVNEEVKCILYSACEFFVMPNRTLEDGDVEGYGIVFNEANLFGKPGIGGNSGGVPEAIVDGETGMLIDSNSISAIAEAIISMLEDPLNTIRMGQKAQQWIDQHRSSDLIAYQTGQFLKEIDK